MEFNPARPFFMHLDINSCFATIEQQDNPKLRGIPVVVSAYNSPGGCILAASIEAKKLGIKTGMRVRDAKSLYSSLVTLTPRPQRYREVHLEFRKLLSGYSDQVNPMSIDEFCLNLEEKRRLPKKKSLFEIAVEVKKRIRKEIGEWMSVSIGFGPNSFLAKTASNLRKPDGLEEINLGNFLEVYQKLSLTDLTGISSRNQFRLNSVGIFSTTDFYNSPIWKLKAAFESINGYYWYLKLRGWEIPSRISRKSFGNSYALPHSDGTLKELLPILSRLVQKTGFRVRKSGYKAGGVGISLRFRDATAWTKSEKLAGDVFDDRDIFKSAVRLLVKCPKLKKVHTLSEWVFNLSFNNSLQLDLFGKVEKRRNMYSLIDRSTEKFGDFVISPATTLKLRKQIEDRIAFGQP